MVVLTALCSVVLLLHYQQKQLADQLRCVLFLLHVQRGLTQRGLRRTGSQFGDCSRCQRSWLSSVAPDRARLGSLPSTMCSVLRLNGPLSGETGNRWCEGRNHTAGSLQTHTHIHMADDSKSALCILQCLQSLSFSPFFGLLRLLFAYCALLKDA